MFLIFRSGFDWIKKSCRRPQLYWGEEGEELDKVVFIHDHSVSGLPPEFK